MLEKLAPRKIGWEAYIYLVYLGMLVFQPFFDPTATWLNWLAVALLIAVFLPLYFWTWLARGPRRLWGVGLMVLLGVVSLQGAPPFQFFNSGGTVFFVYAAAATPYVVPRQRALYLLLAILGVAFLAFVVSPVPFPYRLAVFVPAFVFVPLIGAIQLYQAEKDRTNARLRMAQDEIEHLATIAERERIARDLHDLLGHTLSSITLKSELAHKLARKDPERAEREMREVERISREALSEVRMAVSGYRSRGFLAEVAAAKLICEAAGVSFAFKGDPKVLSALQESALSLVLREAVTNVARHACASRCYAELSETPEGTVLEIGDDGVGKRGLQEGGGLANIRERAALLGGRLELSSGPGFRLTVLLPKQPKAALAPSKLPLEAR